MDIILIGKPKVVRPSLKQNELIARVAPDGWQLNDYADGSILMSKGDISNGLKDI